VMTVSSRNSICVFSMSTSLKIFWSIGILCTKLLEKVFQSQS
jgi:hypothetical protein